MEIANTFKIYTLGCKVNQCDSRELLQRLLAAGFVLREAGVDVAIVNTCAVTKAAVRKDRRMIAKARKENPGAKIVLWGCFPATYKNDLKGVDVDLIWPTGEIDALVEEIKNVSTYVSTLVSTFEIKSPGEGGRARYFLKVQDGCDQFCSYCNIPHARGELRSVPMKKALDEAKVAVEAGYREIVLCGIHLGRYGRDSQNMKHETKNKLEDLLKEMVKIRDLGRVRLSSIEAGEVSDELIDLMKKSDKICDHLHISLQAGSDKILKQMNRPYDKQKFENKIEKIRKEIPDVAITTDVIVGFPGENKKDFEETCDFVEKMKFSRLHVFPFSAHEKTPAFRMKNQLSGEVKKRRAEKLRRLGSDLVKKHRDEFLGKKVKIVVESVANGEIAGKTEHYAQCRNKIENVGKVEIGSIREIIYQ